MERKHTPGGAQRGAPHRPAKRERLLQDRRAAPEQHTLRGRAGEERVPRDVATQFPAALHTGPDSL